MKDLILIDKPVGITSFDVIRQLRRRLSIRKMGHAGTLDPLASGLMIIGLGQGTKQLSQLIKLNKEYVAEIMIGEKRSTGDMEGSVIASVEEVELAAGKLAEAVASLVGTLRLPVSAYSAIKKDGIPMYKRARQAESKGESVLEVPEREMKVYSADIEETRIIAGDGKASKRIIVKVRFTVGSGTYIRSLAEELGNKVGYPATLYSLCRTKVGEFDIKDAKLIDDIFPDV